MVVWISVLIDERGSCSVPEHSSELSTLDLELASV